MRSAHWARVGRLPLALGLTLTWLLLAPRASSAEPARDLCTITEPRLAETSGLVVADQRLFVVNDGGTGVEVFELDMQCRVVGVSRGEVDPFDVEDLARAPDGTLWLADIGDNDERRETVALEALAPSGAVSLYRLAYPDGAHDAEALLLDGAGRPYIVTKDVLGSSSVYTPERALAVGATTPLRKVTTLRFGGTGTEGGPVGAVSQALVTGGAVSVDGHRVALRTYTDLYLWSVPDGDIEAALRDGEPVRVALPAEEQGEAVTFMADGTAVLTVSEGLPAAVHWMAIPPPAATETSTSSPDGVGREPASEEPRDATDSGPSPAFNAGLAAVVAAIVVFGMGRLRGRDR